MTPAAPTRLETAEAQQVGRLRVAVMRLSRRLRQQGNVGITPSQLAVLSSLNRQGPMTLTQLAEAERVQPPSMTRIVNALVEAGFALRQPREEDRRATVIALSPRGRRALESMRAIRNTWLIERLETLDESARADLWRGLEAIEMILGESR